MKTRSALLGLAAFLVLGATFAAQPAPAGSTGQCKDGSYTTAAKKKGACSEHGGVKSWYGHSKTKAAAEEKATSKPAKSKEASTGSSKEKSKEKSHTAAHEKGATPGSGTAPSARSEMPSASAEMPAAKSQMGSAKASPRGASSTSNASGGGAGKVWVNKPTKVYHCAGDRWYGKTKDGAYMSEAQAKAEGYRPDHGKDCASR